MKKVIELIRVSTESQAADDRASIPAQRAINRRTAQSYNLEIVRSIEMTDVSGAAVLYAPEMRELLTAIQSSDIHGVITREFSRLMRPENYGDFAILQAFVDTNTILYLPDGAIDFSSKSGRLLGTIRAAIAGMERTEIIERIWTSKEEKRRQGKFAQSKVCLPTGVDYTEEKGFFYTEESEKVREAFRLFLTGSPSYSEAEKRTGLSQYALRNILQNPIYTGWRVIDKKRDMSLSARMLSKDGRQGDRRKIKRSDDEIIRVKVIDEPLITQKEFDRVQALIAAKKKNHWRTKSNYVHRWVYHGFLFCSLCGSLIYTKLARNDYYFCKSAWFKKGCVTRYMRREKVEAELDEIFTSKLTNRRFLESVAARLEEKSETRVQQARIVKLKEQVESLKRKRSRVIDTFIDGIITSAERDAKIRIIESEIVLLQDALRRELKPAFDRDQLANVFSVFNEFAFLQREDKRKLLSTIAPEIRIADYFIEGIDIALPNFDGDKSIHTDTDSHITARNYHNSIKSLAELNELGHCSVN